MTRLLLHKDLSKDLLQVIGYYVFIAGFIRLGFPIAREEHWIAKIGIAAFTLWLIWYVSCYTLLHVIRPIVKLYFPDFTLPNIDEHHERPDKWWSAVFRRDFCLMYILFFATLYIGWFIVGAGLESVKISA